MNTESPNPGDRPQTDSTAPHPSPQSNPQPNRTVRHALNRRRWIAPTLLLGALVATGVGLASWKIKALEQAGAAAAGQAEPMESITVAVAEKRTHQQTSTSIGTVVAMRSITLRNEIPGTLREVHLTPGQIVEPGTLLVALDVSVEEAELKAQKAQAALAETLLGRMEKAVKSRATSQMEVDRARSELDVANAQIARIEAIIARKTIRAPFRARVGISDVHPGQYLNEGSLLTTLQGVDQATHVDFSVSQQVAQWLKEGVKVQIYPGSGQSSVTGEIVALDAKVDPATRNTTVRARVARASDLPAPGASVRVQVPAGSPVTATSIPVSALRKGPSGDHVFVISPGPDGQPRAQMRHVQTGPSLGDEVMVISGLSAGEQVAAMGSFKLRENVLVAIAPNQPQTDAVN